MYRVLHIIHKGRESVMAAQKKKLITPEYNRRASLNYSKKFDHYSLRLEKGLKEKIIEHAGAKSINQYIIDLILADLEKKGISPGEEKTTTESIMPDGITEEKPFR